MWIGISRTKTQTVFLLIAYVRNSWKQNLMLQLFWLGLVIQVVLFEGWMLGFKPLPVEVVKAVDPQVRAWGILFWHHWYYLHMVLMSYCRSSERSYHSILSFILQLEIVNKNLEAYYDAWDKFIKSWIVIKIKDPSCVYQWRLQVCFSSFWVLLCVIMISHILV